MKKIRGLPPVFVVSLARAPDRRADISARLQAAGVAYELVDAVDGLELDLNAYADRITNDLLLQRSKITLTRGQIGCFLSHYNLWKKIIDANLPYAVVLEDDAVWDDDFFTTAAKLPQLDTPWDVVLLCYRNRYRWPAKDICAVTAARKIVQTAHPTWGTVGYAITLAGARKAYAYCHYLRSTVDDQWREWWKYACKFYLMEPPLGCDTTGDDISGKDSLMGYNDDHRGTDPAARAAAAKNQSFQPNDPPAVSVLMPVYNAAKFLREAIDSVCTQTFTDFEFVIVDDASTDDSIEIVRSYKDPRIRLVQNKKNRGVAATLNVGLKHCRGELIARMDADDVSDPLRFAKQVNYLQQNPEVAVLGSWGYFINGEETYPHENSCNPTHTELKCSDNQLLHNSVMLRRSVINAAGGYPEDTPHAEDYALWMQLTRTHRIVNLPEFLITRRMQMASVSMRFANEQRATADKLRGKTT